MGKHFKLELLYIFILQNYILEELNFCQSSHKKIRILDFFKGLLRKKYKLLHLKNINFCLSKNFYPEPNDIIIWDKRLFHSPWATKLKYGLNFSLPPNIENLVPNLILEPPCFPRSLLSFDVGKKSAELKNYLENWISIRKDYKINGL